MRIMQNGSLITEYPFTPTNDEMERAEYDFPEQFIQVELDYRRDLRKTLNICETVPYRFWVQIKLDEKSPVGLLLLADAFDKKEQKDVLGSFTVELTESESYSVAREVALLLADFACDLFFESKGHKITRLG